MLLLTPMSAPHLLIGSMGAKWALQAGLEATSTPRTSCKPCWIFRLSVDAVSDDIDAARAASQAASRSPLAQAWYGFGQQQSHIVSTAVLATKPAFPVQAFSRVSLRHPMCW